MSAQSGAVNLSMSTEFMFLFCSKCNLRHEKDMRSPQIFMVFALFPVQKMQFCIFRAQKLYLP